jgi:hypothetical protein
MKKQLYAFAFSIMVMSAGALSDCAAQGGVYFREDFATGTGATSDPGAGSTVTDFVSGVTGLTWKFFGVYLTTGTSCFADGTTGTGNRHIRSTNNNNLASTDTPYVILPEFSAGISMVKLQRSRSGRRFTFWVNNNNTTDVSDGGWTLVNVIPKVSGFPNPLCLDSAVTINSASARRLMIKFERAVNCDIDSVEVSSVGALPARLGGINLLATKDALVKVEWMAYNELNVKGYAVERSLDGVNFSEVGFVAARNVNAAGYSYTDRGAASGIYFYRIRSVDKDGKSQLGNIARIQVSGSATVVINLINPVRGKRLEMQLTGLKAGSYRIAVNAADGSMVASRMVSVQGTVVSSTLELPQSIGKGLYTVTVSGTGFHQARRVIVE